MRLPASSDHMLTSTRSNGALNLQVMAFYPGGIAQWFYTLPSASRAAVSQPTATLALHQVPETLSAVSPAKSAGPAGSCGWVVDSEIAQIPVVMGFKQSQDAHLTYASFTYSTTDALTIGVGVSYTGPDGGFTADGTVEQSSGGSTTFGGMVGEGTNELEGDGVYLLEAYNCDPIWELVPKTVNDTYGTPGASPVGVGYCVKTSPNTTLHYDSGTQETFSGGVNISSDGLGDNLSVQDGWSSDAELTYAFGSSSDPVCGQSNYPTYPDAYIGVIGVH